MTLERPDLPACASLRADRLLRWSLGARDACSGNTNIMPNRSRSD